MTHFGDFGPISQTDPTGGGELVIIALFCIFMTHLCDFNLFGIGV